jgi:hypothetical protein
MAADDVHARISLLRLPLKRVHLSSGHTAGIDFRLRRRLASRKARLTNRRRAPRSGFATGFGGDISPPSSKKRGPHLEVRRRQPFGLRWSRRLGSEGRVRGHDLSHARLRGGPARQPRAHEGAPDHRLRGGQRRPHPRCQLALAGVPRERGQAPPDPRGGLRELRHRRQHPQQGLGPDRAGAGPADLGDRPAGHHAPPRGRHAPGTLRLHLRRPSRGSRQPRSDQRRSPATRAGQRPRTG